MQTDELTWTVLAGSTNHDSGELVVGVDANISLPTLQLVSAPIVTLAGPEVITDFSWWREGELARETGWGLVDDQITVEIEHGYAEGSFQHQLVKGIALGVAARVRAPAEGQQPTAELTPGEQDQLHPYRLITIA